MTPLRSSRFLLCLVFICSLVLPPLTFGQQMTHITSITVVSDDNYPPYIMRQDGGALRGILVDQWKLWGKKTGIAVRLVAMDWDKAQQYMAEGRAEVIDTMFLTDTRAKLYDFSRPWARIEVPIFFQRNIGGISDAQSLHGFTVGVKEGDAAVDFLKAKGVTNLELFPSYEAIVRAAADQKIRVFCIDSPPARYFLYKFNLEQEFRSTSPLYMGEFHRAVRKGNTALLRTVEDGFSKISAGEYASIERKWMGTPLFLHSDTFRPLLYGTMGVGLIALALVLWNYTLRRQVALRTAELHGTLEALQQSEAQYREIFENTSDGVFLVEVTPDQRYKLLAYNPVQERMLGISAADAVGRFNDEYLPPEVSHVASEDNRKCIEAGLPMSFEGGLNLPTGRYHYHTTLVPVRDKTGRVARLIGVTRDITELEFTKSALQDSQRELAAILSNTPEIIYKLDPEGRITFVNDAVRRYGYDPATMIGTHIMDYVHPEDLRLAEHRVNDRRTVARSTRDLELRMFTHKKDVRNVEYSSAAVFDEPVFLVQAAGQYTEGLSKPRVFLGTQGVAHDITERKQAVIKLAISEERYRRLFEDSPIGIVFLNTPHEITFTNQRYRDFLGLSEAEIIRRGPKGVLHPDDYEPSMALGEKLRSGEIPAFHMEQRHIRGDGRIVWADTHIVAVRDKDGKMQHTISWVQDITQRKETDRDKARLQEELAQAKKMESVGRLAGGVAHDFNNLLSVILGNAEMAIGALGEGVPPRDEIKAIQDAAARSADLTRQLLAFARKQSVVPRTFDLNEAVTSMLQMLQRLIGEDIELVWKPGADLWRVKMDRSQVDQIMANLCVNARDAVAGVGKLTISTENAVADEAWCQTHFGWVPGQYVQLKVSDTGAGMSQETLEHIFEPFFTTKEVGKGTGLGLATVYGIVKQNNGFIDVSSELAKGTTFTIYLPRTQDAMNAETAAGQKGRVDGTETVLVVEDEESVLALARTLLERSGYKVLAAQSTDYALALVTQYKGQLDLLITDVVMPGMNGRELYEKIAAVRPKIKTLFMSGHNGDAISKRGVIDEGIQFLQKPFTMKTLLAKVREVIDEQSKS